MMAETPEARLKRLRMRSSRRGIKEMDLILSPFADTALPEMNESELSAYDALLAENDQDLYLWVTGQASPPRRFKQLVGQIAAHAREQGSAKHAVNASR